MEHRPEGQVTPQPFTSLNRPALCRNIQYIVHHKLYSTSGRQSSRTRHEMKHLCNLQAVVEDSSDDDSEEEFEVNDDDDDDRMPPLELTPITLQSIEDRMPGTGKTFMWSAVFHMRVQCPKASIHNLLGAGAERHGDCWIVEHKSRGAPHMHTRNALASL